ncbi:glycosyltransferase family 61 protein [Neotabrizicola shimadae]|uniref:Glycosyltransferase family 61 protein n=1 Tax=Neotabrizicola shimadae TaxID=2807096 RepID=A0A8G1EC81_9RHOB|nr:glycosyltransferase family 61 protein [Neotabrizicola shimadae]QYZ70167.1 glycosyltransferase family 61 protein [Neotabrizicola shimadae]
MAIQFDYTVPDISGGVGDRIALVEGAIVVPPAKGLGNQSVQRSGVLTPDGRLVEEGITWRGQTPVTIAPAMPPGELADLKGTWMFLGPLFGHFGHFLVESICRIWAFGPLKDKIDGVIYVPKFQNRPDHVANVYRPFLQALGVTAPMVNLEDPTRVERLYVPAQGFGMFQMIEGAPEYRDFVRAHAGKGIEPKGAEKIYISRSALPAIRGSVLGEKRLEALLEAEGYEVFHPQKHPHDAQIAAYRAARQIVGVDCSPLHLLALVGDKEQKTGIVARRDGDLDQYFARQIRAFQGAEAWPMNFLIRNWIEADATRPSRTSWGEVDFTALHGALLKAGLIANPEPWPRLTEAEIAEEVARIGAGAQTTFKPYEGPKGKAPSDAD